MDSRNKGGRPFSVNPLAVNIKIRLTAADAAQLDKYCMKHGTRRAIAIRGAILHMLDADNLDQTEPETK